MPQCYPSPQLSYNQNQILQKPHLLKIPYNGLSMIKILLFAALKDIAGAGSLDFPTEPGETQTAHKLWSSLVTRYPDLIRYEKSLQIAVNQTHAQAQTPVSDGDEIAFFPPVSGGSR